MYMYIQVPEAEGEAILLVGGVTVAEAILDEEAIFTAEVTGAAVTGAAKTEEAITVAEAIGMREAILVVDVLVREPASVKDAMGMTEAVVAIEATPVLMAAELSGATTWGELVRTKTAAAGI